MATVKNPPQNLKSRVAPKTRSDRDGKAKPADLRTSIDEAFQESDGARAAITANLKKRARELDTFAARARDAFAGFNPSKYSAVERERRNYLPVGGDLELAMDRTIERGLEAIRGAPAARSLKIRHAKELDEVIPRPNAGAVDAPVAARLNLELLLKLLKQKLSFSARPDPALTACEAEREANRRLAEIEADEEAKNAEKGEEDEEPDKPSQLDYSDTKKVVQQSVARVLDTVSAPECQVTFAVPARSDQPGRNREVASFELRAGPADVTSYHDFHSLQIAFDHVWTEIFHGKLESLGRELYEEYVKLVDATGFSSGQVKVSTPAELRRLLETINGLGRKAKSELPWSTTGIGGSSLGWGSSGLGWSSLGRTGSGGGWSRWPSQQSTFFPTNPTPQSTSSGLPDDVVNTTRLEDLLQTVEKVLSEPYAFDTFAPRSINFGIMVTYRQQWVPEAYQVGDLVSTIPLSPKEVRRYTVRKVSKKTRAVKEVEDNLDTRKSESSNTSRVDAEIVDKAQNKTNFSISAKEALGGEGYSLESTQNVGGEDAKQSERTKKKFREDVLKSAQEYKHQHRTEIDSNGSSESEDGSYNELQNPNDELTVTYAFYELQRRYRISEKIHHLTPVVLVANEVPSPDQIDDAWLMEHDWILRRAILDDSFKPALDYLTQSFVGAALNIQMLDSNVSFHRGIVDNLGQQLANQNQLLTKDEQDVLGAIRNLGASEQQQGMLNLVKGIFDPLKITGDADTGAVSAAQVMVDYAQEQRDRAEREKTRLLAEIQTAVTALQAAIDRLSSAVREHYDKVTGVDRLRLHVKDNILYYMQAIWSHEPPDQRFFRLYDVPVPDIQAVAGGVFVQIEPGTSIVDALQGKSTSTVNLPLPNVTAVKRKLVEVADLDTVLGYKGNYLIFALKENNYLTLNMMQNYLELSDEVAVRDPDEAANYTVKELQEFAACLYRRDRASFDKYRDRFKDLIIERLKSGRKEDDVVIVPTSSLYIDAIVGTHPLLEDFKLIHRALDVKKVQAEVRHAELENVRLGSRALKGKDEDPDIEKKIVIEGGRPAIALQPDDG